MGAWWFSKPYVEDAIAARVHAALARRGFAAQVAGVDWDRRARLRIKSVSAERADVQIDARDLDVTASMHHLIRGRVRLTRIEVGALAVTGAARPAAQPEADAQADVSAPPVQPDVLAPGAEFSVADLTLIAARGGAPLAQVQLASPEIAVRGGRVSLRGSGSLTVRDRVAPVDIDATVSRDAVRAEAVAQGGAALVELAAPPHGRVRVGAATIERRDGHLQLRAGRVDVLIGAVDDPTIRLRARAADLTPEGGVHVEDGTLHLGADPRRAVGQARALLAAVRGQLGSELPPSADPTPSADSTMGVARAVRLTGFAIHTTPEHPLMTDATVRLQGEAIEVAGAFGGGALTAAWRDGALAVTVDDVGLDTTWSGVPLGGRLTGTATLRRDPVRVVIDGHVAQGRLHHPAIATAPITGIKAGFKGTIAVDKGSISFEKARVRLGAATAVTTLTISDLPDDPLTLRAGVPEGLKPLIDLRAKVEPLPCQAAIKGVPAAILGPLQDVELAGFFHPTIRLRLPFGQPTQVRLETTGISKDGCEVDHLHLRANGQPPADVAAPLDDVGWLNADFVLPVREGVSEGKTIKVGPGTPDYVRLEAMPGYVGGAAYLSEEMGFFTGSGVSIPLIAKALGTNLTRGRFAYGGSTVTQQLVKNLFLTRKKTLARKFQEAIIAARIARAVSKERVLELYLNCIEFGPDLYGIGPAAQHYFQKGAHSLTPMEAVFLAMLKPAPRRGAWYRRQGRTPKMPYWEQRARLLLERLEARGLAPAGTADAASPYLLRWADGRYLGPPPAKPIAPTRLESPQWE